MRWVTVVGVVFDLLRFVFVFRFDAGVSCSGVCCVFGFLDFDCHFLIVCGFSVFWVWCVCLLGCFGLLVCVCCFLVSWFRWDLV